MFDNQKMLNRLKQKFHDVTISEWCEKTGIARSTITHLLNGTSNPRLDTLLVISDEFNVSLDWICGLSDADSHEENVNTTQITTGLSKNAIHNLQQLLEQKKAIENAPIFDPTTGRIDENLNPMESVLSVRHKGGPNEYSPESGRFRALDELLESATLANFLRALDSYFSASGEEESIYAERLLNYLKDMKRTVNVKRGLYGEEGEKYLEMLKKHFRALYKELNRTTGKSPDKTAALRYEYLDSKIQDFLKQYLYAEEIKSIRGDAPDISEYLDIPHDPEFVKFEGEEDNGKR